MKRVIDANIVISALIADSKARELIVTIELDLLTPAFVHDEIETYEELIVEKLAAALTYAIPYAEGEISERVAARELDLRHAFAIDVPQALRDVLLDMKTVAPYFEEIRNAREQPPTVQE